MNYFVLLLLSLLPLVGFTQNRTNLIYGPVNILGPIYQYGEPFIGGAGFDPETLATNAVFSTPLVIVFQTNNWAPTESNYLGVLPSVHYFAISNDFRAYELRYFNGDTWITGTTNGAAPVSLVSVLSPPGSPSTNVSLTVYGYSRVGMANRTNDLAGQHLLVDRPATGRAAANRDYVLEQIRSKHPTDWSSWPATDDVVLQDRSLIFGNTWSMESPDSGLLRVSSLADEIIRIEQVVGNMEIFQLHIWHTNYSGTNVISLEPTNTIYAQVLATGAPPVLSYTTNLNNPTWKPLPITSFFTNEGSYWYGFERPEASQVWLRASGVTEPPVIRFLPRVEIGGATAPTTIGLYDSASGIYREMTVDDSKVSMPWAEFEIDRLSAGMISGDGSGLTGLNASELAGGTVPAIRLGSTNNMYRDNVYSGILTLSNGVPAWSTNLYFGSTWTTNHGAMHATGGVVTGPSGHIISGGHLSAALGVRSDNSAYLRSSGSVMVFADSSYHGSSHGLRTGPNSLSTNSMVRFRYGNELAWEWIRADTNGPCSLWVSGTVRATNGVVLPQLSNIPTNLIPTSSSGNTNWVLINLAPSINGGGPQYVARGSDNTIYLLKPSYSQTILE